MKKKEASTKLRNMVQLAIEARKAEERISPAWIATEVMTKLGGTEVQQSKPLLYLAALQHVHEIARQACRKQFETDDDALDPAQQELFPALLAFRMGRMVAAGWIPESTVLAALLQACEDNGKIRDDGGSDKTRATIASGLNAGKRKPLTGLPERPKHSWQPIDGDDDNMWVRSLRSEIRALYRMRFPGSPAAIDEADERLFEIIKTTADPWIIGRELRLALEEYKCLSREAHGRRSGARLPARMRPCDVSRELVEAYLKDRKRAQNLTSQTAKRAKKKAEQQLINDLDDKESAILTFLRQHPRRHSVDDIYKGVRRSRAFKGMKAGSIKNVIRRLVAPPSEKARNLSQLLPLITVTKGMAKSHGSKLFAEIRKDPI